jgi:HEAT repeat protein
MKRLLGAAALLLCAVGPARCAEVPDLVKQLKSANTDDRRAAAEALGKAGAEARTAAPALIAALKDGDAYVRTFAAQALGQIEADPKAAVPALAAVLKGNREKEEVQEAAAEALGKLGGTAARTLSDAIKDMDKETRIRRKAVVGLGQIGPDARDGLAVLIDVVKGKYAPSAAKAKKGMKGDDLRPDAATALGEIATAKDADALAALEDLIGGKKNKKDKALKKTVGDAIKKIKDRN